MHIFKLILTKELLISYRRRSEYLNSMLFFVLVVTMFPLASSADPSLLRIFAPSIIWVAALFAALFFQTKVWLKGNEREGIFININFIHSF